MKENNVIQNIVSLYETGYLNHNRYCSYIQVGNNIYYGKLNVNIKNINVLKEIISLFYKETNSLELKNILLKTNINYYEIKNLFTTLPLKDYKIRKAQDKYFNNLYWKKYKIINKDLKLKYLISKTLLFHLIVKEYDLEVIKRKVESKIGDYKLVGEKLWVKEVLNLVEENLLENKLKDRFYLFINKEIKKGNWNLNFPITLPNNYTITSHMINYPKHSNIILKNTKYKKGDY